MKERVGIIGVGLMGHGIARNVLKHGYSVTVLEHPGNQPLDELLAGGAATARSAAELADRSDFIILCVTGSPEVEAVLKGPGGALEGLRPGAVVIDCSTAIPAWSIRMAEDVAAAGGHFIDAPMTRTAQHAHEGKLNLLVGGNDDVLYRVMPLLRSFAENISHVGPVGAGHRVKLLHNFVSLGCMALIAEAAACAERSGIAADVLVDVLASGGGAGVALDRLRPCLLEGDTSGTPFFMSNALKDLRYYGAMAEEMHATHAIADAVAATFETAVERRGARALLLELSSILSGKASDGGA